MTRSMRTTRGPRIVMLLMVTAILMGGFTIRARAQSADPGQPMTDAERALVAQHPDQWANLTPDQRERVLENYRKWQQMTPADQHAAQRNFQEFRRLPPDERRQVIQGLRQWRQLPVGRAIKLREHVVPNLEIPIAVAIGTAGGFAATPCISAVPENLGAGSAGARGAHCPKVGLVSQAIDLALGKELLPEAEGFVIVLVDGNHKPVGG